MIALLQRVNHADITVEGNQIARIQQGLLVFIGIERGDSQLQADIPKILEDAGIRAYHGC